MPNPVPFPEHAHCVICATIIPDDRGRKAVTCSKECYDKRNRQLRKREDDRRCRYCRKPSTPEKRSQFHRWHNLETRISGQQATIAAMLDELPGMLAAHPEMEKKFATDLLRFLHESSAAEPPSDTPQQQTEMGEAHV